MTRKLYRFQPLTLPGDDRLSLLQHGEVWVSDPKTFNDPFDLNPCIENLVPDHWSREPEFVPALRSALACLMKDPAMYQGALFIDRALTSLFQEWVLTRQEDENDWDTRDWDALLTSAIKARIAQFGVVCLTPKHSDRLMWAHYASNGQGFCIEYEVDPFENSQDLRYVPVQYASAIPRLCLTEAMFTPHQFLQRVMATKHADWAYEQEIRLVCLAGKGKVVKVDEDFVRMTGLIAGYAMPDPLRAHLKATAARLGVSASVMDASLLGRLSKDPL